jgi:hypothetical protein
MLMDNIHIIDDFLNETELKIVSTSLEDYTWHYGHSSGKRELVNEKFFANYDKEDFYLKYIKEKIENYAKMPLNINRFYRHVQTFGQNGSYHIDAIGSNKYTFCLYITDVNDNEIENAGGDFLIKIPDSKAIVSVATKNNRGILFPSSLYHKGLAYNCGFNQKRTCITWKFETL